MEKGINPITTLLDFLTFGYPVTPHDSKIYWGRIASIVTN